MQSFDPRFVSSGFTLIAAWQNYDLTVKPSLLLVPEEGKSSRRAKKLLADDHRLGKAYALFFGSRGANVVVNDLGGSFNGQGQSSKVHNEILILSYRS